MIAWYDGGDTNLANLTLLCSYHHHQFAQGGWQCRINGDGPPSGSHRHGSTGSNGRS
ncbi:MAG TPA: hypothetical protein VIT41_09045 [Microlunatus sp.]